MFYFCLITFTDQFLVVIGGMSKHKTSDEVELISLDVENHLAQARVKTIGRLPHPLSWGGGALFRSRTHSSLKIPLFCGSVDKNNETHSTCWRYSTHEDTWTEIGQMTYGTRKFAAYAFHEPTNRYVVHQHQVLFHVFISLVFVNLLFLLRPTAKLSAEGLKGTFGPTLHHPDLIEIGY
jgi:hypothetical protein